MQKEVPWQLQMFSRTLKKKLKLDLLRKHLGNISGRRCLLITCGDNNGALNYYFRDWGGRWTWAEVEHHGIQEMEKFLGEKVYAATPHALPFTDESFDCVVSIDVHEHLADPTSFNRELARVVKRGGRVIVTVPNGDWWKPANLIKYMVGMTKKKYGHMRIGYNLRDLQKILSAVGFQPYATGSYSKFFTEVAELVVNFAYVMVLAKKGKVKVEEGTIAPSSQGQLKAVSGAYRLYSLMYPLFWLVSQLDRVFFFTTGYAVVVEAKRP
jgi:2-polyprenyl-3-methyl-5-hydroxy-6-metoxy-1,4-benzoquinol methylase